MPNQLQREKSPYLLQHAENPADWYPRGAHAPEEAQRANIISDMLQIKLNWQTPPVNSSIVPLEAEMATLCIDGGKKAKMRPGDVLGALTGDIGLDGADIGKIAVHPAHVYVAVRQAVAHKAWKQLQGGKIKGKTCRVRLLK